MLQWVISTRRSSTCATYRDAVKSTGRRPTSRPICAGTPASDRSAANGSSAARVSPVPTSFNVTSALTRVRNASPAPSATSASCDPIIWPNIRKLTKWNGPRRTAHRRQAHHRSELGTISRAIWANPNTTSISKTSKEMKTKSPVLNGNCLIILKLYSSQTFNYYSLKLIKLIKKRKNLVVVLVHCMSLSRCLLYFVSACA